jgi:hypothetical protein
MAVDWTDLGVYTVTPNDLSLVVGSFSIGENDDTIWLEIQKIGTPGPWPWSYGVVTWQTTFGNELGSIKAYTASAGEVFRLGVGRQPRSRTGSIIYRPRSFNLAWVKEGNPLTLSFAACSGTNAVSPVEAGGGIAFPVVDGTWRYQQNTGLLRLKL